MAMTGSQGETKRRKKETLIHFYLLTDPDAPFKPRQPVDSYKHFLVLQVSVNNSKKAWRMRTRGEIGVSASPIIGPTMPGNEKGEAPIGCPPPVREVKLSFVILY